MNLQEFGELVGEAPRQLRFLITEGVIPKPEGTRKHPIYDQRHVDAVRRYAALRQEFSLSQVKAILQKEGIASERKGLLLAPGILVTMDASVCLGEVDPKEIASRLKRWLITLKIDASTPG